MRAMDDRVAELELKFMQQEQLLEELSAVLYRQQRELDQLNQTVAGLQEKLRAEPGLVDAKGDEPPPHY
jgi:SlyX protein